MLLVGSDFIDNDASFNTQLKREGAKVFVQTYATSGMVADTPYAVQFMGSGYNATALAASIYAYVGVHKDGEALASGCVGWVQIRGNVENVQAAATSVTGSVGHAVYWAGATGLGASSSANTGNPTVMVGVLTDDHSGGGSTTINMYLCGLYATPI